VDPVKAAASAPLLVKDSPAHRASISKQLGAALGSAPLAAAGAGTGGGKAAAPPSSSTPASATAAAAERLFHTALDALAGALTTCAFALCPAPAVVAATAAAQLLACQALLPTVLAEVAPHPLHQQQQRPGEEEKGTGGSATATAIPGLVRAWGQVLRAQPSHLRQQDAAGSSTPDEPKALPLMTAPAADASGPPLQQQQEQEEGGEDVRLRLPPLHQAAAAGWAEGAVLRWGWGAASTAGSAGSFYWQ
jgi:hypothetical protein